MGQASCLRGDCCAPIFRPDADRRRFLDTLGEACAQSDWQESGKAKAERWGREELARRSWRETDLRHRQSDPARMRVPRLLRTETMMMLAGIARRLRMGVETHGSNLLASRPRKGT